MAIATNRHGAPAPAPCPRVIIEKESTRRVRAHTKAGVCAFRNEFRGRTRDGGEKPVQTAFPSDKLQPPFGVLLDEFVVPFGDAQDLIDRFDPIAGKRFFAEQRSENLD
jgi:hypothetical protein